MEKGWNVCLGRKLMRDSERSGEGHLPYVVESAKARSRWVAGRWARVCDGRKKACARQEGAPRKRKGRLSRARKDQICLALQDTTLSAN